MAAILTNIHIKNLALIDELEVDFFSGLNILTGETGAGKSILIGSINLALGGRMTAGMIREGAPYALVELVFSVQAPEVLSELEKREISLEDGQLILSRKMMEGRSTSKINGETCTISQVREIASLLLDIHGQNEHQSLLDGTKQLAILDESGKDEIGPVKARVSMSYKQYKTARSELEAYSMDEGQRQKECDFLTFEIEQIEEAALQDGEDVQLESRFRTLSHGQKLLEAAGKAYQLTGGDGEDTAAGQVGRALRELQAVASYDRQLEDMTGTLTDVDSLLGDFNRELAVYLSDTEFSEEEFSRVEDRLNEINLLKSKYGDSVGEILDYQKDRQERLTELTDFARLRQEAASRLEEAERALREDAEDLTKKRNLCAKKLEKQISGELAGLNFADVRFQIAFSQTDHFTASGTDHIDFLIATNPGERLKPLRQVASGGELSRIMLAIKTILAQQDSTETLIFDEIDAGISGRTAQLVSEKMARIGAYRQILCITHLPQIAAMADTHYLIEKHVEKEKTVTMIERLDEEGSVAELSRLIGGTKITDTVTNSAREMKELAQVQKNTHRK